MATVTELGNEAIARLSAGVSPLSPFLYLSTGSGTTLTEDSTNISLEAEHPEYTGLGRVAATCEYMGSNRIRWSHTYTLAVETTISEVGIFNSGLVDDGAMFLRHTLPAPITLYEGDELEISLSHLLIQ
jgi:hypothetical protein